MVTKYFIHWPLGLIINLSVIGSSEFECWLPFDTVMVSNRCLSEIGAARGVKVATDATAIFVLALGAADDAADTNASADAPTP